MPVEGFCLRFIGACTAIVGTFLLGLVDNCGQCWGWMGWSRSFVWLFFMRVDPSKDHFGLVVSSPASQVQVMLRVDSSSSNPILRRVAQCDRCALIAGIRGSLGFWLNSWEIGILVGWRPIPFAVLKHGPNRLLPWVVFYAAWRGP